VPPAMRHETAHAVEPRFRGRGLASRLPWTLRAGELQIGRDLFVEGWCVSKSFTCRLRGVSGTRVPSRRVAVGEVSRRREAFTFCFLHTETHRARCMSITHMNV